MLKLQLIKSLKLSQMQDIGGVRIIVGSVEEVKKVHSAFLTCRMKHQIYGEDDYIAKPKDSGYRSIHLKLSCRSKKRPDYNGKRVEIQIRTQLQHEWATAVEILGSHMGQALKSGMGDSNWKRFFVLVAGAYAIDEGCSVPADCPESLTSIREELRELSKGINLDFRFKSVDIARDFPKQLLNNGTNLLLEFVPGTGIKGRSFKNSRLANDAYSKRENELKDVEGADVVLIRVDSLEALRKAYPNYLLDMDSFKARVRLLLKD